MLGLAGWLLLSANSTGGAQKLLLGLTLDSGTVVRRLCALDNSLQSSLASTPLPPPLPSHLLVDSWNTLDMSTAWDLLVE